MKPFQLSFSIAVLLFLKSSTGFGQLQITTNNIATALAQKLVGEGVVISNATIPAIPIANFPTQIH